jgi:hypothetical protein
MIEVAREMKE